MIKNKKRIAYFDFAIAPGGSIVVLRNTLLSLDKDKIEAIVFTALEANVAEEFFGDIGVKVVTHRHYTNYVKRFSFLHHPFFRSPARRKLAGYLFALYSILTNAIPFVLLLGRVLSFRPHLIHTHNGIDSMIVSILLGIPAILHLHGPFGAESQFEVWLAKKARKCMCVSQGLMDMLIARGVDSDRVVVVGNPSPIPICDNQAIAQYQRKFGLRPDIIKIAHVGRLVAWKGQREYLHAFFAAAKRNKNIIALIIGGDVEGLNGRYVSELHNIVESSGLSDRVIFTGQIKDVHNLVACADVVVHSSMEPEPFGLVVTEAMALGKPVIASCFGATAEIVDDGVTGLLVRPDDEAVFAEAIHRLVNDESLRVRMGAAALVKARREYSIESYRAKLLSIYDGVYREAI